MSVRSDMIEAVAKDLITDYPDISPAAWRKMAEDMLALFLPDDEGVPPWMEFADCWDPARGDDSRSGVYYDDEIVPADARPLYRMKP